MKIVTINVPEAYVEAMAQLTGEKGIYPSRSELIRSAVKEFLLKELNLSIIMSKNKEIETVNESKDRVSVPIMRDEEGNIKKYKTYKILRRLEI